MFLPIHDNTPLRVIRFQFVTGILLIANILVFVLAYLLPSDDRALSIAIGFGAIPALITDHATLDPRLEMIPEAATLITYMFFHAGWLHLISNMAFLWVFADNVEDAFGHIGFAAFYLVCGVAAGLTHAFMQPDSQAPLIGASGAVSGVMAAYMICFPHARVWILLFLRLPLRIPAYIALLGWFGFQFFSLYFAEPGQITVAWWAHIGGFIAGGIITLAMGSRMRRRFESPRKP